MHTDILEGRNRKPYDAAEKPPVPVLMALDGEAGGEGETDFKRRPFRMTVTNAVLLIYTPIVCGLLLLFGAPWLMVGMVGFCLTMLLCVGALQEL